MTLLRASTVGLLGASLLTAVWAAAGASERDCGTTFRRSPSLLAATPTVRARANLDEEGRRVRITWLYHAGQAPLTEPDASRVQEHATRFDPTAVELAPPDRAIVAGRLGARTIVEVWTLRPPDVAVEGDDVRLGLRSRAAVDLVLDAELPSLGCVKEMLWNRGRPQAAFVRFTASRGLYELALSGAQEGELVKVLDVADEPLLARTTTNLWAGDHTAAGYVYVFEDPDLVAWQDPLLLRDSDRDGALDFHGPLTDALFESLGLGDVPKYAELRGLVPVP